jgi:hypothetical protein
MLVALYHLGVSWPFKYIHTRLSEINADVTTSTTYNTYIHTILLISHDDRLPRLDLDLVRHFLLRDRHQ